MPSELSRVYVPFSDVQKATIKGADGKSIDIRLVKGLMTDESLDLDGQKVDATWAKGAAEKWFSRWGNIREQHSQNAIGKSVALDVLDAQKAIDMTGKVVDPMSIVKIDEEILSGWSVGIKGARVVKDATAPNGRIVGGEIVEVSLVDHPANENCKVALVKSAKTGKLVDVEQALVEKIAGADETKLAAVETEKKFSPLLEEVVADIDGLNKPDSVPAGDQTELSSSSTGTPLDVNPESPLRRKKKKLTPRDGQKAATIQVDRDGTVTVWADGEVTDGEDVDGDLGGSLTPVNPTMAAAAEVTKSEEDIDMLYAKALVQIKDLLTKGDTQAALGLIEVTETLTKQAATAQATVVEPVVEVVAVKAAEVTTVVEPVVEPAADTSKAAEPDTAKAIASEVSKAVASALKPLVDKIEALEKRAAPGGPILGPSKLLSAGEQVLGAVLTERLDALKEMAENHPDGGLRLGAKQLIAEITKAS